MEIIEYSIKSLSVKTIKTLQIYFSILPFIN